MPIFTPNKPIFGDCSNVMHDAVNAYVDASGVSLIIETPREAWDVMFKDYAGVRFYDGPFVWSAGMLVPMFSPAGKATTVPPPADPAPLPQDKPSSPYVAALKSIYTDVAHPAVRIERLCQALIDHAEGRLP